MVWWKNWLGASIGAMIGAMIGGMIIATLTYIFSKDKTLSVTLGFGVYMYLELQMSLHDLGEKLKVR